MGPVTAVKSAFANYFTISGRARRSEFWWFFVFYLLALFALFVVIVISVANDRDGEIAQVALILLAITPPLYTVIVRRLHDKGLTGWIVLLTVVPFGQVAILILCALPGDEGPNAYGPDPLTQQKPAKPQQTYAKSNIPRVEDDD